MWRIGRERKQEIKSRSGGQHEGGNFPPSELSGLRIAGGLFYQQFWGRQWPFSGRRQPECQQIAIGAIRQQTSCNLFYHCCQCILRERKRMKPRLLSPGLLCSASRKVCGHVRRFRPDMQAFGGRVMPDSMQNNQLLFPTLCLNYCKQVGRSIQAVVPATISPQCSERG